MTTENETETIHAITRAEVIKLLSDSVKMCAKRATTQRCRDLGGDETRLKYARCLAQLATPLLNAIRDDELEKLTEQVENLQKKKEKYDN